MSPTKKIYLSTAIFGTLSILLLVFIVFPLFKGIKETSRIFLSEREKTASLVKEGEGLEKMKDFYRNYQSDFERIENVFIDPEVPVEFISFLENNANVSQTKLDILSMAKKSEKGDPWPSLSLQLSVIGSFPNFLEFLEKLEQGPYPVEISGLNTRSLTEKELGSKEFEGIFRPDTITSLSVKVFTR